MKKCYFDSIFSFFFGIMEMRKSDMMIYLDYSATTPVHDEVLSTYVEVCKNFIGNPNSLHKLGVFAKRLIDASSSQIASILNIKSSEIIYTSGASESNNTAIKGICFRYQNRGKHIITTELEHSSIIAPLNYLQNLGFEVDFVHLDEHGRVDLEDLKRLIREDTILVSVCSVNSEVGVRQPLKEISQIVHQHSKCFFHSDVTQSIGKEKIDFSCLDLASFSAQKFFGMKGIGCLIKKQSILIEPIIHGGKSTTVFRSGTPPVALITSLAKALRLSYEDFEKKTEHVLQLHDYFMKRIRNLDVFVNSNSFCIPHIINFSLNQIQSETMLHALEEEDIYISTQTACSVGNYSRAVFAITKNKNRAMSSMRVSLSYLTTMEELDQFFTIFTKKLEKLSDLKSNVGK